MKLFLYRTLDSDEDGDPVDHGVLRAMTIDQARQLVLEHIGNLDNRDSVDTVRIYPLRDRNTSGILEEAEMFQDFDV